MLPRAFTTWCLHDGAHSTKRIEYSNWNDDLLEPVVKDIAPAWKAFEEQLEDFKEAGYISLVALIDNIREDLNG